MSYNVWEFIGVHKSEKSQADLLLKNIYTKAFNTICEQLELDINDFNSIKQLIKNQPNEDFSYFFDWLNEEGMDSIKKIESINLKDTEEILHFLQYREMLLDMDIENNILESILISVAETITSIDEFMDSYLEQAATSSIMEDSIIFSEPQYFGNFSKYFDANNFIWNNTLSPADSQQDFCYYYYEVIGKWIQKRHMIPIN